MQIIFIRQGKGHSDCNRKLWFFCHSVYDENSVAKDLRERLTNLENVNGIEETKEEAIQFVIIDCDLFVIQSAMTICGKHHLQTQEQYESSKAKAIQIIIVDCDPLVIQSMVKNLWRKGQSKAKEQTEYQQ